MDENQLLSDTHQRVGVSAHLDEITNPGSSKRTSGTQAQESFLRLSAACYFAGREVAQRCALQLPSLLDLYLDQALLVVNGQRSGALGFYAPERWAYNEQPFDEIHVNIGHGVYAGSSTAVVASDIVLTICHELVHLYARTNNIRDTSGRGNRYHNKRFAELARRLELRVERSGRSHIGFQTTGFTERGATLYADLITQVERELRLLPNFTPSTPDKAESAPEADLEVAVQKYVFAQCGCRNERGRKRTIRMAHGWWRVGTIGCAVCKQVFTESPPERTKTPGAS